MERFAEPSFKAPLTPATMRNSESNRVSQLRTQSGQQEAFTLIELLVVIAIIAV